MVARPYFISRVDSTNVYDPGVTQTAEGFNLLHSSTYTRKYGEFANLGNVILRGLGVHVNSSDNMKTTFKISYFGVSCAAAHLPKEVWSCQC